MSRRATTYNAFIKPNLLVSPTVKNLATLITFLNRKIFQGESQQPRFLFQTVIFYLLYFLSFLFPLATQKKE